MATKHEVIALYAKEPELTVRQAAMQKSYSSKGYCILNHLGDIWTPEWFLTEHIANRYIAKTKRENPTWDLSKHTVVPARHVVYPKRSTTNKEDG